MKKLTLPILILLYGNITIINAQNVYPSSGNVGIGTSAPAYSLDVNGTARVIGTLYLGTGANMVTNAAGNWDFINGAGSGWFFRWIQNGATPMTLSGSNNLLIGTTTDGGYRLDVNGTTRIQGAVRMSGITSDSTQNRVLVQDLNGNLYYRNASTLGGTGAGWSLAGNAAVSPSSGFLGTTDNSPVAFRTGNTERMRIDGVTGNISIGTTNAQGYALAVNGSAIFTSAFVKPNANWPDYVFTKDYPLPSLASVAKYIQVNHHLPEIPSADSIEKKGIDLGASQTLVLKKIEELTLYLIQQNKELEVLQQQNKKLAEQNQKLDDQAGELKMQRQKIDRLELLILQQHKH